jgi:hypothetical protein
MNAHQRPDRNDLRIQLENYRMILDANADFFAADPQLEEKIDDYLAMLSGHLDRLVMWEKTGGPIDDEHSIDQVSHLLVEIKGFVANLLTDDAV